MRALRLPTCVSAVAYLFRFRRPRDPSCLCVRRSAPGGWKALSRPGQFGCRPPVVPAASRGRQWDLSGLQAIHPVPLLRSLTPVEPMCPCHDGHIGAAPRLSNSEGFVRCIFRGSLTQLQHPLLLRFAFRVATHAQGWLPAGWLAFTGRVSNPLDHYEGFQIKWSFPLPVLLTRAG
jgi:hypothetical protein